MENIHDRNQTNLSVRWFEAVNEPVWCLINVCVTSAGVVRGPVFAGHAHHLRALGLVSLLAADFTARAHHVPVVLSSGRATAHVTMFNLNGCTPRRPYKRSKESCADLFWF